MKKKAKVSKKDKKEIKKAVEKLPGLIIEQVRLSEPAPHAVEPILKSESKIEAEQEKKRPINTYHGPRQVRWLWVGVISFCLVIFSLWGWNMYILITDATEGTDSNKGWLPDPVSDDLRTVWQEIGAADNEADGKETIKEKVKSDLRGLMTQIKNASAFTATSTAASSTEISL